VTTNPVMRPMFWGRGKSGIGAETLKKFTMQKSGAGSKLRWVSGVDSGCLIYGQRTVRESKMEVIRTLG